MHSSGQAILSGGMGPVMPHMAPGILLSSLVLGWRQLLSCLPSFHTLCLFFFGFALLRVNPGPCVC